MSEKKRIYILTAAVIDPYCTERLVNSIKSNLWAVNPDWTFHHIVHIDAIRGSQDMLYHTQNIFCSLNDGEYSTSKHTVDVKVSNPSIGLAFSFVDCMERFVGHASDGDILLFIEDDMVLTCPVNLDLLMPFIQNKMFTHRLAMRRCDGSSECPFLPGKDDWVPEPSPAGWTVIKSIVPYFSICGSFYQYDEAVKITGFKFYRLSEPENVIARNIPWRDRKVLLYFYGNLKERNFERHPPSYCHPLADEIRILRRVQYDNGEKNSAIYKLKNRIRQLMKKI